MKKLLVLAVIALSLTLGVIKAFAAPTHWVTPELEAGSIHVATVPPDTAKPTATVVAPVLSTNSSKNTTFKVSWSATDPAPSSGIASYNVYYRSLRDTVWRNFKLATTANHAYFTGSAGNAYLFKATARDYAGNVSPTSSPKQTIIPYDNSTGIVAHSGFNSVYTNAASSFYNDTVRYSVAGGEYVTYRFTGKSFHLIGTKGATRSQAKIYIDGVYVRTVDEYSATARFRQRLYYTGWAAAGTHAIKIENLATAGRPRFDIDAIGVER